MANKVDCTGCGRFLPGRNRVSILERNIYLLMLGLDNSGKTCTAKTLVGESLDNVAPTIGFSKVSTKYKGFNVTIYDLGGSKSFRGIWPKYYHEVHGFVFVVDASDTSRMEETAEVFETILQDDKVKGKPILMLCNKADIDEAQDEVHVVNSLNVERLVNAARCPTRVEPSIATKNHGLKDGFKWLVKSIIANMTELGPRIDRDVEEEQKKEAERREEVRKRIEEQKAQDGNEADSVDSANEEPPGFVPIDEVVASKSVETETTKTPDPDGDPPPETNEDQVTNGEHAEEGELEIPEFTKNPLSHTPIPPAAPDEKEDVAPTSEEVAPPEPLKAPETLPPLQNGSRRNSSSTIRSNGSSRRGSQTNTNGVEAFIKTGKMDLEPTANTNGLKKVPFGRKMSNSSVKSKGSAGSRRSSTNKA